MRTTLPEGKVIPAPEPPGLAAFVRLVEIVAPTVGEDRTLADAVADLWTLYVEGCNRLMFGTILHDFEPVRGKPFHG